MVDYAGLDVAVADIPVGAEFATLAAKRCIQSSAVNTDGRMGPEGCTPRPAPAPPQKLGELLWNEKLCSTGAVILHEHNHLNGGEVAL